MQAAEAENTRLKTKVEEKDMVYKRCCEDRSALDAANQRLRGACDMEAKRFRDADAQKPHDAHYWRGVAWAMATRMESELKEKP
jgi:hypothetical protein